MGVTRTIHFAGSQDASDLLTLFDCSVAYSCIRQAEAAQLAMLQPLPQARETSMSAPGCSTTSEQAALLTFTLNDLRLSDEFLVVSDAPHPVIIGELTQRKWQIKINEEANQVLTDPRVGKFILR